MKLPLRLSLLVALACGMVVAGCREQLTAPGSCPATCPGGTPVLIDTVLDAIVGVDSTHAGYFNPGSSQSGLRVANGLNGATNYAVIRFLRREDSLPADSTQRTYAIDSMAIDVFLLARDTTVSGIRMELHRLPLVADSALTFAGVDGAIVPGTLVDSVTIADSVPGDSLFKYRFVFFGDTTPTLQMTPADSGRLELAFSISGATATGIRIGGFSGAAIPVFWTYVTVNSTDTTTSVRKQFIKRAPAFTTFLSNTVLPPPDSTLLAVGTPTGARAFIRFPWPAYLRDSALLARATLELLPESAINGLPGDTAFVDVYGALVDFGAKSPLTQSFVGTRALVRGSADTVRIDVISELGAWQGKRLPHAPMLVVSLDPEGTSFTEPRFYSTRSPVAARRPRLRITYQAPFDFERP